MLKLKNFFLFSLSVSMLFACGAGGFYLWKHEKDKVYIEEENKKNIAIQKQAEERARLDEYYTVRLMHAHMQRIGPSKIHSDELDKIWGEMRLKGYRIEEITILNHKAFKEASNDYLHAYTTMLN